MYVIAASLCSHSCPSYLSSTAGFHSELFAITATISHTQGVDDEPRSCNSTLPAISLLDLITHSLGLTRDCTLENFFWNPSLLATTTGTDKPTSSKPIVINRTPRKLRIWRSFQVSTLAGPELQELGKRMAADVRRNNEVMCDARNPDHSELMRTAYVCVARKDRISNKQGRTNESMLTAALGLNPSSTRDHAI